LSAEGSRLRLHTVPPPEDVAAALTPLVPAPVLSKTDTTPNPATIRIVVTMGTVQRVDPTDRGRRRGRILSPPAGGDSTSTNAADVPEVPTGFAPAGPIVDRGKSGDELSSMWRDGEPDLPSNSGLNASVVS
jgi:hypothetical protein